MSAPENLVDDYEPDYEVRQCTCGIEEFFRMDRPTRCNHRWTYLYDQPINGPDGRVYKTETVYC